MNTNQKIFGGVAVGGIIAAIIYYKYFNKPAAAATTTAATGTTAFTGTASFSGDMMSADGNPNVDIGNIQYDQGAGREYEWKLPNSGMGFTGPMNADGTATPTPNPHCVTLMNALKNVQAMLMNPNKLAPSQMTNLRNDEMYILAQLQKLGCNGPAGANKTT